MSQVNWKELKEVTCYNSTDLRGFAEDEGFRSPLSSFQKIKLAKIVLCNFAVREGFFSLWSDAKAEYVTFCKETGVLDNIEPMLWLDWLNEKLR